MTLTIRTSLAAAMVAMALIGCKGGGGSTTETNAPADNTVSLTGKVADGYLQGATVCLDLNTNLECDAGEPTGTTDVNGSYTLTGVTEAQAATYPVVVKVTTETTDADEPGVTVTQTYTLTAPPGEGGFISPLTTLWKLAMQANAAHDIDSAEQAILQYMRLDGVVDDDNLFVGLGDDFIAGKSRDEVTYQLMHAVAMAVVDLAQLNLEAIRVDAAKPGAPVVEEEDAANLAMTVALDRLGDLAADVQDLMLSDADGVLSPSEVQGMVESMKDRYAIRFTDYPLGKHLLLTTRRTGSRIADFESLMFNADFLARTGTDGVELTDQRVDVPIIARATGLAKVDGTDNRFEGYREEVWFDPVSQTWKEDLSKEGRLHLTADGWKKWIKFAQHMDQPPNVRYEIRDTDTGWVGFYAMDDPTMSGTPVWDLLMTHAEVDIAGLPMNLVADARGWSRWIPEGAHFPDGARLFYRQEIQQIEGHNLWAGNMDFADYNANTLDQRTNRKVEDMKLWVDAYDEVNGYPSYSAMPKLPVADFNSCTSMFIPLQRMVDLSADDFDADVVSGCAASLNDLVVPAGTEPGVHVPMLDEYRVATKQGRRGTGFLLLEQGGKSKYYVFWHPPGFKDVWDYDWNIDGTGGGHLEKITESTWSRKTVHGQELIEATVPPVWRALRRSLRDKVYTEYAGWVRSGGIIQKGDVVTTSLYNKVALDALKALIPCSTDGGATTGGCLP